MLFAIFTIILINLLLSIDNIIPILLLADSLPTKKLRSTALFSGLLFGGILRVLLVFFAAKIFLLGNIVYIVSGIFLLYIGLKGLIKKEEEVEGRNQEKVSLISVIASIGLIDITLSLDNVAAIVAISQDFKTLFIGIILGVFILFGISFVINQLIHKVKGLDFAAYIAILFLAFKFLAFPFGIEISSTITSGIIVLICLASITYATVYSVRKVK